MRTVRQTSPSTPQYLVLWECKTGKLWPVRGKGLRTSTVQMLLQSRVSGQKSVREQKADARRESRRRTRMEARGGPEHSLQRLFALAAGVGVSATCLVYLALRIFGWADREINPEIRNLVLVISFFVTFLTSVLVLIQKFYPLKELRHRRAASRPSGFKLPKEKWGGALAPTTQRFDKVFDETTVRKVAAPAALDDGSAFDGSVGGPRLDPRAGPDIRHQSGNDAVDAPRHAAATDVDSSKKADSGSKPAGDEEEGVSQATLRIVLGDLRKVMASVSDVLAQRSGKLDRHAKFGLNLLFAGVCARLTKHFELSAKEGQGLLARLMELTGSNAGEARVFADQINEYGEHSHYRKMIEGGGEAIGQLLSADQKEGADEPASLTSSIGELLETWEQGRDGVELPEPKVFMFTEIVDAGLLGDELNEESMRRVLEVHDSAVRESLGAFSGREVKHTKVGILALFDDARAAIDAAVQMQQTVNLACRQSKEIAFDIRIGLHAGQAISQGSNFFGEALKIAALVCSEAGGEEIWVSKAVWASCPAYADDLRYCGEFSLGPEVDELYMMLWERLPDPKDGKVDYADIGKQT